MSTDIDRALDALGDRNRRTIVGRLAASTLSVGEIAEGMPIGRTAVSMHLRVLKSAGLVSDRAVGNRRVYHLEPDALQRLRNHLDWYWERSLSAYQKAAEAKAKEKNMTVDNEITVSKTVRVEAPITVAFNVFVSQDWWPVGTHHLAKVPGHTVVLEPFVGGRWYERAADGTETDWGTVLVWQPPYRLLLTWQVSPDWTYETDPDRASEIELTFQPENPAITRVDLKHRHLERYGPDAEKMRKILDGRGGEPLNAYANHVATAQPQSQKEKK